MSKSKRNKIALLNSEKGCRICYRPAFGNHYGVFSCYACKMFFRRTIVENLTYHCKKLKKCFENFQILPNCQFCRYQKCLELGMELTPPSSTVLPSDTRLSDLLEKLTEMDRRRHLKLISSYSVDDPSLDEVLRDRKVVNMVARVPGAHVTAHEWAFLDAYSYIVHFCSFDFIDQLGMEDKKTLFSYNYLRTALLGGAMRTFREKRDCLLTPSGEDVYPKDVHLLFKKSPGILNRICCEIVGRLIELKVTNEEYLLLILIFFCNPAIPHYLSPAARSSLSTHQKMYSSALFQYCQLIYQSHAPSRYNDLLSMCHVINRTNSDLQYVSMMFQCYVPSFKFKKLVSDTFVDSSIGRDEEMGGRVKIEIMD